MSDKIIVYSTKNCVECDAVKQYLTTEGYPFEVRDVLSSEEYQAEVEKFGFLGVPVTVVGEKAIKGFNPDLEKLVEGVAKQG
ncbi:glutaredoxin family protein [Bacillus horti]|uniref:Glutaredoxin-like protein NrdH n=1 Tax=Caldalkalibacillus horti TaxID=77523 RepID=A0ABT9VV98_9BACI|nr:glutaredoxin family protein [Bacillus horti]MDQ0164919.1 glutaredoxin-like protein NrdH [Bacillus horti]